MSVAQNDSTDSAQKCTGNTHYCLFFLSGPIRVIIIVVTVTVLVTLLVLITGATVVVYIIRHRKKKGITISYFYI